MLASSSETWIQYQGGPPEVCDGQIGVGTGFFFLPPNMPTFSCQNHFTIASYLLSDTCCFYQKDGWVKPGNPPKSRKKGGIGYRSTFSFFFICKRVRKKHGIPFILIVKPLIYFSNCCELRGLLVSELWHAIAQLVEALRYKSECHGFDSWWCHWNFSLT